MTDLLFDKEKVIARIEDIKNGLLELAKIPCSAPEEFQIIKPICRISQQ